MTISAKAVGLTTTSETLFNGMINNKSIEDFKKSYLGKHKKGGIDINLRGIKKFLIWCIEEEYIKKMPKVIQFNEKTPPKYINQVDWNRLMECDMDDYWKDVWKVYRDIGARLKEILMGKIEGSAYTSINLMFNWAWASLYHLVFFNFSSDRLSASQV